MVPVMGGTGQCRWCCLHMEDITLAARDKLYLQWALMHMEKYREAAGAYLNTVKNTVMVVGNMGGLEDLMVQVATDTIKMLEVTCNTIMSANVLQKKKK